MKVIFHQDFAGVYTTDPAAAAGRLESVLAVIEDRFDILTPSPAAASALAAVHTAGHISRVRQSGLYPIAALAAGAAIQTALTGLREPAFGLLRPPGHHASGDSAWGFCYFNNMAVALTALKSAGRIKTALVLDIDLHHGDGTENLFAGQKWVAVHNPWQRTREAYVREVAQILSNRQVDLIGVSAGFDYHREDWGGLLATEDYAAIGALVRAAADACGGGCFALLEGGYNHDVLGQSVAALLAGMG
ncbi:MAG: histone deacetylase family protein [Desulfobacterales bacterium]